MTKYERLNDMLDRGNGYITSSAVAAAGISRTYLAKFIKENRLEQVSHGIYVREDCFPDELFILQNAYPKVIFSGETALDLNGLIDREYSGIYVTVPQKFNGSRLRKRNIHVHQEKDEIYELGQMVIITKLGNPVRTYDRERCVCDLVKNREKTEAQNFQTAIKEYMGSNDKNLSKLIQYAKVLNIRDEVMKYVEVLI